MAMNQAKLARLHELAERCDREPRDPMHALVASHLRAGEVSEPFAGIPTLLDLPHRTDFEGLDVALVGVPFDLGVTARSGARHGPRAIRGVYNVGLYHHVWKTMPVLEFEIADVGDVPIHRRFSLEAGITRIEEYYHSLLNAGVVPLSAGGDHSITYPILKAVGRDEPVGLVHIDAHCDTAGPFEAAKFHHGGPFRNAALAGVLDPDRTIQIGIRGASEVVWEFSYASGMTVVHIEEFHRIGLAAVIEKAREVVGDGPTYVSVDVDGIDPAYTPGTGTPEVGGLTVFEVQSIIRGLRGLDLVGGDVVEVAPMYDATDNTARVAASLLFETLSLLCESVAARRSLPT